MLDFANSGNAGRRYTVIPRYSIERPEPKVVIDYRRVLARASDVEFREAPLFILHGDDDTVPYQGALDFQTQADVVGIPFAFHTVVGRSHAFYASETVTE